MLHCWNQSPDLRPSFSQLVIQLEDLLQTSQEYLDISTQAQPILTYQPDQYLQPNPGPDQSCTKDQRTSCAVSCQDKLASKSTDRGDRVISEHYIQAGLAGTPGNSTEC